MKTGNVIFLLVLILAGSGFLLSEYFHVAHERRELVEEREMLQQENSLMRRRLADASDAVSSCYSQRNELQAALDEANRVLDSQQEVLASAAGQQQAVRVGQCSMPIKAAVSTRSPMSILLPASGAAAYQPAIFLPFLLIVLLPAAGLTGFYRKRKRLRPPPRLRRQKEGDGEVWVRMTAEQAREFARLQHRLSGE